MADSSAPTWLVRHGSPRHHIPRPSQLGPLDPAAPNPDGDLAPGFLVHRGPDGAWFWFDTVTFHVHPDARVVDVYPEPDADDAFTAVLLLGPVAAFVLYQLGAPSLHASAVMTQHGAVAFLGPKGRGKSTLAAACLARGAALLTDDLLPLSAVTGEIHGVPGPPLAKVWRETAQHTLGLSPDTLPRVSRYTEKRLATFDTRFRLCETPVPLRRVYTLERGSQSEKGGISSIALSARDGLTVLLRHLQHGGMLTYAERAANLPILTQLLGQADVRALRFPSGFEHHDAVFAHLLRELGAS